MCTKVQSFIWGYRQKKRFLIGTKTNKSEALNNLLTSPTWKVPLNDDLVTPPKSPFLGQFSFLFCWLLVT
jgi:hypothetical protein